MPGPWSGKHIVGFARGISHARSIEAKRAEFAGSPGIRRLPHPAEHGAAGELRLPGLGSLHTAEHFAGERIERLPGAISGLVEQRRDERIG